MSEVKEKKEVSFTDYLSILLKWKRFLLINFVLVVIISTLVAFLLPKWYKSSTSIKPLAQNDISFFSSILGGKGLASVSKSFNIGGLQYSDLDYYSYLLQSRSISMKMIYKFDLKARYDKKYYFKTIQELIDNSSFDLDPTSNTMTISVLDTDPAFARQMVVSYLDFLSQMLDSLKNKENESSYILIERRFEKNKVDLEIAENNLKQFQEKFDIVLPEEQFINTIKVISELEAQKLLLETKLQLLKKTEGSSSPNVYNLKTQLDFITNKIKNINDRKSDEKLLVSYKYAPDLINRYVKLYREVKIQTSLLEMIYPLVEETRLNRNSNSAQFLIIDKPNLPEYKDKPKRAIVILVGVFLGMFLSLIYIFIMESYSNFKEKLIDK